MSWTRRSVLAGLGGLAAPAWALGEASQVDVVELALPTSVSRPNAWRRLLYELQQSTSVETADRAPLLSPDDFDLFDHPFAVLAGAKAFAPLSDAAVEQLRRYLDYGGFLYVDDTSGLVSSPFAESVARLSLRLFPTRVLAPLSANHSIFRAFFLNPACVGRVATQPYLEGIELGTVTPFVFGRNDLSGALDRSPTGRDLHECTPGGEWQRTEAVKLGINLVMYALTSNYKYDQAHTKQLIEEGRLE